LSGSASFVTYIDRVIAASRRRGPSRNKQIVAQRGAIDIWINDAMVTVFGPVWTITPEEFRRVTEVTYLGMVHGTMAALRHMQPRNRGTIVQVGSALAYCGIPLQAAYYFVTDAPPGT
jgi:NAD(P)-dependent dehydrogenase (short-subunit alcohol dehydrogenase family)